MKTRYVAFIVRIRLDETATGIPGNPGVQGSLHQAGSSQMHPFDSFDRLVELLHSAIDETDQVNQDPLQ
jgi:hypothetical protein